MEASEFTIFDGYFYFLETAKKKGQDFHLIRKKIRNAV